MKYNPPVILLIVGVIGVIAFYYRARKIAADEARRQDALLTGIDVDAVGHVLRPDGSTVGRLARFGSEVVNLEDFNAEVDRRIAMD